MFEQNAERVNSIAQPRKPLSHDSYCEFASNGALGGIATDFEGRLEKTLRNRSEGVSKKRHEISARANVAVNAKVTATALSIKSAGCNGVVGVSLLGLYVTVTVTDPAQLAQSKLQFQQAAGQQAGTISTTQSAEDLARLLLGIHLGIRVLARARPERDLLEGLLRPAFALLDSPAS